MKCMRIAFGVACALGLTMGSAYAANGQWQDQSHSSIRAAIDACHKLPSSERGICKAEAQRRADARYLSMPVSEMPASPGFIVPDQAAVNSEVSRYKRLASECHRAPSSEHNSCVDEASLGLARPARLSNLA